MLWLPSRRHQFFDSLPTDYTSFFLTCPSPWNAIAIARHPLTSMHACCITHLSANPTMSPIQALNQWTDFPACGSMLSHPLCQSSNRQFLFL